MTSLDLSSTIVELEKIGAACDIFSWTARYAMHSTSPAPIRKKQRQENPSKPGIQVIAAEENVGIRVKQCLRGGRVVLLCLIGLVAGWTAFSGLLETVGWRGCRSYSAIGACDEIGRSGATKAEPTGLRALAAPVPTLGLWLFSPTAETETPDNEPVMAKAGKISAVPVSGIAPARGLFYITRRKFAPLYLYYQSLLC